jgi:uncharacterized membrane protein YfcA
MEFLLLVLVGLAAGFLGALVGLGGGIIIVPLLLFMSGGLLGVLTPQMAVGTSLFTLVFTGLSSALAYLKQGNVDYRSAFLFLIGIAPGSLVGGWANQFLQVDAFNIFFGILMVFFSFLLMIRGNLKPKEKKQSGVARTYIDHDGKEHTYGYGIGFALSISFAVGFLSSLFGIGGGALMVPVMLLVFHFPPHLAVGTSMLLICLSAIIGSVTHIVSGNVIWIYALALIPGGWLGAKAGAYVNARMKSTTLVLALRIMLIVVGVKLIWDGARALL